METVGSNPVEAGREMPPPLRTRRRRVRQKVHTPAYASLNGSSGDQILDLSEIVDISEEGMAIQTSFPLQIQRNVDLCLDLAVRLRYAGVDAEVVAGPTDAVDRALGMSTGSSPLDAVGNYTAFADLLDRVGR